MMNKWFVLFLIPFCISFNTSFAQPAPLVPDTAKVVVKKIVLIGNKRTVDRILHRELMFQVGDTLDETEMESASRRSSENLMNTLLFNKVDIQRIDDTEGVQQSGANTYRGIEVYILVQERWYIFPAPIFELADRNFNEWWKTKQFSRTIYGGYLYWNNFRGRNETLVLGMRLGYTQEVTVSYNIPYINKKQKDGIAINYYYNRNHETSYRTFNSKQDFFKQDDGFVKREWQAGLQYSHRQAIYNTYYIAVNEHFTAISDTIASLNPDYFLSHKTEQRFTGLRFYFKHDHRDNVNYPLVGNFFDFEVMKSGLPVFNDDVNFLYFTSQYKKFWKLWDRVYFAGGAKGKLSTDQKQPYFNTRGLGYGNDYLRGYESYVIDGQHYALFKTDLKFELLPTKYVHAGFIPTEKFATIPFAFYINLYADYGYVQDKQYARFNPLANSNLYSFGGGIDFATYYNFVLRVEYSINKFGEKGVYIHFNAPI